MSAPSTRRPAASRSNERSSSTMRASLPGPAPQSLQLAAVALGRPALAPLAAHRLDELALLEEPLAALAALLGLLVQARRLRGAHAARHRAAHDHLGAKRPVSQLHPISRVHLTTGLGRLSVDLHPAALDGVGG